VLTARSVGYTYRSGGGVRDVDLQLTPGITALVGANGAGKSTLMALLSGAMRPREGSVELDGVDLYGRRRADVLPRVSLMPQSFSPVPLVTVEEFVRLFAWLRGVPRREVSGSVEQALADADLLEKRRASVRSLSGGMIRRLLLAQALVSDPSVVVLDEPTVGLDPLHRSSMRALVAGLSDRTVLVSSHLLEDVGALADRVVVLHEGLIVLDEPRDRLPSSSLELEREIIARTRLSAGDAQ
jgi:ABC-2 type transport system ATP-binding protein